MPTYDYRCDACGHTWDIEQRMTEDAIKKCPKCGKLKAKRQITGGNFILKGGGWYADLYSSSSSSKKSSNSELSEPSSSSSSSEAKTETKAETKSEAKTETKSEAKPKKADSKKA